MYLHPNNTTRGYKLEVEGNYGSLICIPLKDLKASNPVELAEYSVANNTEDEPDLKWWLKDVPHKRDQIISKIKSKYWRKSISLGLRT